MATFLAKLDIRVEIENVQNEEEAKIAAIMELSDYQRHNDWTDLVTVEKLDDKPIE